VVLFFVVQLVHKLLFKGEVLDVLVSFYPEKN